jgi:hypothetical protein
MLSWFKSHYDKLIAFVVFLGLLVSLMYLAVKIGTMSSEQKVFEKWMQSLPVEHPDVAAMSTAPLDDGLARCLKPPQIAVSQWKNNLFVPEERVRCTDCRRPIPIDAKKCPFCLAPVRPGISITRDTDGDGMPDAWEEKYGLNPLDPSDADKDLDNDGFSNLLEYKAGTDPKDPNSHPTVEQCLRVTDIKKEPFRLKFKGVQKLPGGELMFQVNLREGERSYFVKLNQNVEGFKVVKYEQKTEQVESKQVHQTIDVDVSVLTLQNGEELIPLVKGTAHPYVQYSAKIFSELDKSESTVREHGQLIVKFKDKKVIYAVIKIDMQDQSVVIRRADDNKEFVIRKTLEFETK